MTVLPNQIPEITNLHNRLSKIKPSAILENRESGISKDSVDISTEGKKRQILEQARSEVLENIRQSK